MDSQKRIIATCAVVSLTTLVVWWWYKKNRKDQIPAKWKAVGKLSDLHLYPLKSGKRIELTEAECGKYGLVQITDKSVFKLSDRCLMVYGETPENGIYEFKTARTYPKMVLIEVSNHDIDHVALDAPNMRTLYVKIPNTSTSEIRKVVMHSKEQTELVDCGEEAAAWISRYMKGEETGFRIGYHDEKLLDRKVVSKSNALKKFYPKFKDTDMGIFSDLSSYMLMNKTSMVDLNSRLENDVSFCQFRPNILVDNIDTPYAEESWNWIKIGEDVIFQNVKPCTRCVFITINAETGTYDAQREPLKTLKKYKQLTNEEERKANSDSPVMGINLGLRNPGIIRLNDVVYIGEN